MSMPELRLRNKTMATLLLKIVYYLAIFCTHASLSFVKAQNLQIQVQPPSVTLRQDDLVVTCSIISPSQLDIVYYMQLEKNNSDTMKNVVSVRSNNGQDVTTWQDSDLQNRASVIGTVSSPATSQLKLTIPKDRVQCPQDLTGYKCTMSGFSSGIVHQETSQMYASYIAHPTVIEMPTVRILGEFSDTPTREFPVGTAIQLTCTGQIGSDASATIRWCAKKSQDFTMTGLPQTPIHSQALPTSGCQYTRSSTITYNLTSDDTYTQFLCESGYSGLCETGKAKQYLNITLDTSQNLRIQVKPQSVQLGQNNLIVTCSIISPSQLSTVYTIQLLKNNSDTMKEVVSIRSNNGQDAIIWQDSDLQNRAIVIGTVSSPATSQLRLTIPKDRVQCPQDLTGYKCTMSGFKTGLVNQETSQMYVSYIDHPKMIEMPTVKILGELSDTPTREFPVGTAIQLTCTGQIGSNASATIRWCTRKSKDTTFTVLLQTPIHSQSTPSGCQYTRSSIITYNLTSDDTYTQFLCESGYSGLCETGAVIQYLNITLERSDSTESSVSCAPTNAQNLRIQVQPPSVNLGQDDLVVTCSIISPSQLSTLYTILLLKNNSDTIESVVSVRSNNGDMITWQDTVLQNRASAEGTVSSPATAQLKLTIPKDRVQCPHDFTGYKCTMAGFSSGAVNQETSQMYVSYIVHPTMIEMPTVRILGEFSDTANREFPVGTAIQLTCTGQIGSDASATIRWCAKKSQDFTMTGLSQTPIHSQATPTPNCQYTRSSTITYNLTSDDTYTQFLCESGYSGLCETGTAKQYVNITLAQNLRIQVQPSSVHLGQNDLVVTCSIISPSQLDTVYTMQLQKNNSDTMKDVVSVVRGNGDRITWQDPDLQNRASVIGIVSSPATAQLKLTIPKDRVQCPQDFTGYKCTMSGFATTAVNQETSQMYVSYIVHPAVIEMPTVRILGEFLDTPKREFPVGTAIQLTCTGQVGSDASATIRWCAKKSQDFTLTGLPQTPIHSQASPAPNCQYTRSSTITYSLTSDDTYTQFLCESGYEGLCETGSAKQYLNITLEGSISTQSFSKCVSTNENLSIIFGCLFGVFFCICVGLMTHIFFDKISKQRNRKCVGKRDKNGDYVIPTVSGFDDHQYQGIDADGRRTGRQENSAQYDVLGSRDPGNVYDRVGDINAGIVIMQSYGDRK